MDCSGTSGILAVKDRTENGFTLIELLITMVLGSLVMTAILLLLLNTLAISSQSQRESAVEDAANAVTVGCLSEVAHTDKPVRTFTHADDFSDSTWWVKDLSGTLGAADSPVQGNISNLGFRIDPSVDDASHPTPGLGLLSQPLDATALTTAITSGSLPFYQLSEGWVEVSISLDTGTDDNDWVGCRLGLGEVRIKRNGSIEIRALDGTLLKQSSGSISPGTGMLRLRVVAQAGWWRVYLGQPTSDLPLVLEADNVPVGKGELRLVSSYDTAPGKAGWFSHFTLSEPDWETRRVDFDSVEESYKWWNPLTGLSIGDNPPTPPVPPATLTGTLNLSGGGQRITYLTTTANGTTHAQVGATRVEMTLNLRETGGSESRVNSDWLGFRIGRGQLRLLKSGNFEIHPIDASGGILSAIALPTQPFTLNPATNHIRLRVYIEPTGTTCRWKVDVLNSTQYVRFFEVNLPFVMGDLALESSIASPTVRGDIDNFLLAEKPALSSSILQIGSDADPARVVFRLDDLQATYVDRLIGTSFDTSPLDSDINVVTKNMESLVFTQDWSTGAVTATGKARVWANSDMKVSESRSFIQTVSLKNGFQIN